MAGASVDQYRAFFRQVDTDGNGMLTLKELTDICKKNGYREEEIKKLFRSVDTGGDEKISEQEFLEAMGCVPPQQRRGAAMRGVFRDFDRDGNGQIEREELKAVFAEMGKHFSEDEVKRMIELMDADGSNKVDYEEFIKFFTDRK